MPLPFYILLGDYEKHLEILAELDPEPEMILEDVHWTLVRVPDYALFWIVGEEVADLAKQFVFFRQAKIFMFISYRQQDALDCLNKMWGQIQNLDEGKIQAINVLGVDFHPKLIKRKQKFLEWCIEHESLEYLDWTAEDGWQIAELFDLDQSQEEEEGEELSDE